MPDKQTKKEKIDLAKAGEYKYGLGRRKTATAMARMYFDAPKELKGKIIVNNKDIKSHFSIAAHAANITKPLEIAGIKKGDVFISIKTDGGGKTGQSEAVRLAISRALLRQNEDFRPVLRSAGFLTRDPRMKERKKPGLRRARRAPQWTKR